MYQRLQVMKNRLEEINKSLESSDILNNMDNFKKISKEKSDLEPVIEKFNEYLKADSDRKDALAIV